MPSDLTLGQKQRLFTKLAATLIDFIYINGYEATFGEAYRTPEQAALNVAKGSGIKNSEHIIRLAVDLNLFKDGNYLTSTEDYALFGEWWKRQNPLCRWGGDFTHLKDGNHFSFEHNGVS